MKNKQNKRNERISNMGRRHSFQNDNIITNDTFEWRNI